MTRLVVTAVGGDLGQAVSKAMRLSAEAVELHGCDVTPQSVGEVFVDAYHVVPRASEAAYYLRVLDQLCRSRHAHAVIPCSEPEIGLLSQLGAPPRLPCGAVVICQEGRWIETYGDKLTCLQALEGRLELASFADGSDERAVEALIEKTGFPVAVKARRSSGSQACWTARDRQGLSACLAAAPGSLVQEHLDAAGGEYTAGVFVCEQFETAIAFHRRLGPSGCSWFAESSDDPEVLDYVRRVARLTGLRGGANIQVRKTTRGVRLLEINPRFSSLVAARALCGFRDVEWSLQLALGREPQPPPRAYQRIRFQRFLHEAVDFGDGFMTIADWSPSGCQAPAPLVT